MRPLEFPWIHRSILITVHSIITDLNLILRCIICSKLARKSRLLITNKRMLESALYQLTAGTLRFHRRTDSTCDPIKMMN